MSGSERRKDDGIPLRRPVMLNPILLAAATLAALAWVTLASPAAALSCLRPAVAQTYAQADADPRVYVLALGSLTPRPGEAPPEQPTDPNDRRGYALETEFTGRLATRGGFDRAARLPVRVEVGCAGPWCGDAPRGDVLMFLERRATTYVLDAGPCPWFAFEPTDEAKAQALACLRGGCKPD
jgi:hypothetical protein